MDCRQFLLNFNHLLMTFEKKCFTFFFLSIEKTNFPTNNFQIVDRFGYVCQNKIAIEALYYREKSRNFCKKGWNISCLFFKSAKVSIIWSKVSIKCWQSTFFAIFTRYWWYVPAVTPLEAKLGYSVLVLLLKSSKFGQ